MGNNEQTRIRIHLCFSDYNDDPSGIAAVLDMAPSAVHEKGAHTGSRTIPNKRSFWASRLYDERATDVGKAIECSIELLKAKTANVAKIAANTAGESYMGVSISIGADKPFTNVPPGCLVALGAMGLGLDIELSP